MTKETSSNQKFDPAEAKRRHLAGECICEGGLCSTYCDYAAAACDRLRCADCDADLSVALYYGADDGRVQRFRCQSCYERRTSVAATETITVPPHKCSRWICVTCGSDAPEPEKPACTCCPVHKRPELVCMSDWCNQAMGHAGPCDPSPFLVLGGR